MKKLTSRQIAILHKFGFGDPIYLYKNDEVGLPDADIKVINIRHKTIKGMHFACQHWEEEYFCLDYYSPEFPKVNTFIRKITSRTVAWAIRQIMKSCLYDTNEILLHHKRAVEELACIENSLWNAKS